MRILLTVLQTFMELVTRICLNIKRLILGDHFLYSYQLNVWTSIDNVKRNFIFVTVRALSVKRVWAPCKMMLNDFQGYWTMLNKLWLPSTIRTTKFYSRLFDDVEPVWPRPKRINEKRYSILILEGRRVYILLRTVPPNRDVLIFGKVMTSLRGKSRS